MKEERMRRQKDDDDERHSSHKVVGVSVATSESEDDDLKPNPLVAQDEEVCACCENGIELSNCIYYIK